MDFIVVILYYGTPCHPQYRNHVVKNKAKEGLSNKLSNGYGIEALEKKFHSLRKSIRREVKRQIDKKTSDNEGDLPAA